MGLVNRLPRWVQGIMMEDQFKLFLAFLCLVSGIPLASGKVPAPNSIEHILPELVRQLWGVTLSAGGLLVTVGIVTRHVKRRRWFLEGLMIEAGGLLPLGASTFVLALTVILAQGLRAAFPAGIYIVFALACMSRFWAISRIVRKLRQAIDQERDHGWIEQ